MLGKKLGNRYEIIALIGSGGMSQVYQARDIYLGRIVAVKVLREQFVSDADFIRRFRREAQAVASLSHSNIVNIYDVGQDGSTHYLVMEMIKGQTLKEYIQEHGLLPIGEAIDIAKQICDALEHAHDNDIIHRDIKPHNILLTTGNRVKVTDFGIARAISEATVTHTKSIMGSVHYFSPEQAKGEIAGVKSDIYSLGIVLYEMLTGHLPFDGESPIGIALKHVQGEVRSPSSYNASIPDDLEKIVLKSIAKNPGDRYDNVRQLRLDLMAVLLNKPLLTKSAVVIQKSSGDLDKKNMDHEDTLVLDKRSINPQKKTLKPQYRLAGSLLGLFVFLGLIWFLPGLLVNEEISVPDLLDKSAEEAQRLLKDNGLKMEISKYVSHGEIAAEHVVNQSPGVGAIVKAGRVVDVVLSSGPEIVLVPNLIGSPRLIAEVNIENAGLLVGSLDEISNEEYPQGRVISQYPNPFEEVAEKTKVDLVISKGPVPKIIPMPNLVGQDLETAEANLDQVLLVLGNVDRKSSNRYAKDIVMEQSVGQGQDILQGNTINLVVSEVRAKVKEEKINLKINREGQIVIQVQDLQGTRVVYEKYHQQGDAFSTTIKYYGEGSIVVYRDGVKVSEQQVPAD